MGFVITGGIPVAASFSLKSPQNLDPFYQVEFRDDLNLPSDEQHLNGSNETTPGVYSVGIRYDGRTAYVLSEGMEYQLVGGTTDAHWKVKGGGSGGPATIQAWSADKQYTEGMIVWYDRQLWRVKTNHTSGSTFEETKFDSATADSYTNPTPSVNAFGNLPVGTLFDGMTFAQFIEKQCYPDVPPTVSISPSVAAGVKKRGVPITGLTISVTAAKKKFNIAHVSLNTTSPSSAMVQEWTSPGTSGGTMVSDPLNLDGKTNTTYRATVTDSQSLTSNSGTAAYTFVDPCYIGSLPGELTIEQVTALDVAGMTERVVSPATQTMSYTVTNRRFCIWAPNTWTLKSISDPNGFSLTGSFTSANLSITNIADEVVPGKVYLLNNPTSQSAFTVTYTF